MFSSKKISTPKKKFLDSSLVENLEIPVEAKRYFTSSMLIHIFMKPTMLALVLCRDL